MQGLEEEKGEEAEVGRRRCFFAERGREREDIFLKLLEKEEGEKPIYEKWTASVTSTHWYQNVIFAPNFSEKFR